MDPLQVAEQFVAAINAHDLKAVMSLMSSNHRFVDSLGHVVESREENAGRLNSLLPHGAGLPISSPRPLPHRRPGWVGSRADRYGSRFVLLQRGVAT